MKEFDNKHIVTSRTSSQSNTKQDNLKPNKACSDTNYAKEIGGRKEGLEPTRYGDWEKKGRCIDF